MVHWEDSEVGAEVVREATFNRGIGSLGRVFGMTTSQRSSNYSSVLIKIIYWTFILCDLQPK